MASITFAQKITGMKKALNFLLVAALLCTTKPVQAQISARIYGNTEDLMELKTRTLAVELMSEDPKLVAKLSKKKMQTGWGNTRFL